MDEVLSALTGAVLAQADRFERLAPAEAEMTYISDRLSGAVADALRDCEAARTSTIPSEEWAMLLEDSGLDERARRELASKSPQELAADGRAATEKARQERVAADRFIARMRTEHPELADAIDRALTRETPAVLLQRWAVTPTVSAGGATPASRAYLADRELVAAVRNELLSGSAAEAGIRLTMEEYEALGHRTLTNLRAQMTGRFDHYQVRPGAGEPVGSIVRVPCGSMDCYRWVPDRQDWVYDEGLSGEIGYPMTEIVFEKVSPHDAAILTASENGEPLV